MKRTTVFIGFALALLALAPAASAQDFFAMDRTGVEAELRGGVNLCIDDDDAECDDVDLGGGFGLYAGFRPLPFVAAGLDFGYYTFSVDDVDSVSTKHFMLAIRGYLPISFLDAYLKLGVGYQSYDATDEVMGVEGDMTMWAPLNVKLGLGATYFFVAESWGQLGAGLDFDYGFVDPWTYEMCVDDDCDDDDVDDDADMIDTFQLNLHVTYIFPISIF